MERWHGLREAGDWVGALKCRRVSAFHVEGACEQRHGVITGSRCLQGTSALAQLLGT